MFKQWFHGAAIAASFFSGMPFWRGGATLSSRRSFAQAKQAHQAQFSAENLSIEPRFISMLRGLVLSEIESVFIFSFERLDLQK